ncbi:MAG: hydroxyacylglutathione hydrolase C-terminal domain-containing protein, partial [Bdellovibrionota bacterium]
QGQLAIYIPSARAVFVGDTMFAMGCGRVFEGSFEQLYASLMKIASLPGDTKIYFGHEYSVRNAEFAKRFDPENREIDRRLEKARSELLACHTAAAPTIEEEKRVNPFLRAGSLERFTELRELRNQF